MKKREVQIHMAVTLMGDPFAITEEDKNDIEICQFAVSIPEQFCGDILVETVKKATENLGISCVQKMRWHGLLRIGE